MSMQTNVRSNCLFYPTRAKSVHIIYLYNDKVSLFIDTDDKNMPSLTKTNCVPLTLTNGSLLINKAEGVSSIDKLNFKNHPILWLLHIITI